MTDPLAPPPRRPMPEPLQRRITEELAAAQRRRPGRVVIPLVAAAVVATMVALGVAAFRDQLRVGPAQTAGPVPATTSATAAVTTATAAPTPEPAAASTLDVRPMTKAEIAADIRSCTVEQVPDDPTPRRGTPEVQYAMVERQAGWTGAGSPVRVLLLEDRAGHWDCLDGEQSVWGPGPGRSDELTSSAPVVGSSYAGGGSASDCGGAAAAVQSTAAFEVGSAVRTVRARVVRGSRVGPWMTTAPVNGFVYVLPRLVGPVTQERDVRVEYVFLDEGGRPLPIRVGQQDRPTRSEVHEFSTCADRRNRFPEPEPIERPRSDAAGIRTCQTMAAESAEHHDVAARGDWTSRLLVSTDEEWGTVLSDGRNLVGCSLFPTKEISPSIPDTPTVRESAFSFAVNPIGDTGASSLWAAGRVPTDVSAISYRLPGGPEVAATIDARGYWMLKHHSAPGEDIGSEENVQDWPPVVVTVSRPGGPTRHTIAFTEETMCRQVSHGC